MSRLERKQIKQGAGVYSKSNLSDWQAAYVMALIEGLTLIDEKAKEKGISDERRVVLDKKGNRFTTDLSDIDHLMDSDALVHYVRKRGDQIVYAWGYSPGKLKRL